MISRPFNGDTYIYANSISNFEGDIIHLGYYLIGSVFHFFLNLIGSTPLLTMAYMSIFFGSLSVVCMFLFTLKLTGNRLQSFIAAMILMFSAFFWYYSISGEVYVPQLAVVLLTVLLIMHNRYLISGLLFLIAISITPTSCLALPPILYLMYIKNVKKKGLMLFILPIIISGVLLVIWDFSKIIGIINSAIFSPGVFIKNFSLKTLLVEVSYKLCIMVYGRSFNLMAFFAVWGFIILYKNNKKNWLLMLSFLLPFLLYLFNLNLFSGDHLIISYITISFLASCGVMHVLNASRNLFRFKYPILFFFTIIYILLSYNFLINSKTREAKEINRVIEKLSLEYNINSIMISDYSFAIPFWYWHLIVNKREPVIYSGNDSLKGAISEIYYSITDLPYVIPDLNINQALDSKVIYIIERLEWQPWIIKQLLNERILEDRKKKKSILNKLSKYWEKGVDEKFEILKIIDSPLRPVYLLQRAKKEI